MGILGQAYEAFHFDRKRMGGEEKKIGPPAGGGGYYSVSITFNSNRESYPCCNKKLVTN